MVITDINAEGLKDAERMLADYGVEVFGKVVNVKKNPKILCGPGEHRGKGCVGVGGSGEGQTGEAGKPGRTY